jgi:hypothetical protein
MHSKSEIIAMQESPYAQTPPKQQRYEVDIEHLRNYQDTNSASLNLFK